MEEKNVTFNHKPTYRHEAIIFWTVKVTLIICNDACVWTICLAFTFNMYTHVLATEVGMQYVHVWEHAQS